MNKVLKDLTKEEFFENLGKLWHHLLTLELYIRFSLLKERGEKVNPEEMDSLKRGNTIDRNSVYNGDYLPDVIRDFNKAFKDRMTLDKDRINELRKAIAHGKIIAIDKTPEDSTPTKIYNFKDRGDNRVEVVYAEFMSKTWFESNIKFVVGEINRVIKVYEFLKRK